VEQARSVARIRIVPEEVAGDERSGKSSFSLEEWRAVARERYNWDMQPVASKLGPSQFVCEYSTMGEGDIRFLHSRAMAAVVRPFDAMQSRLRLVFLLPGRARITAQEGSATVEVGQGDLFVLGTGAVKQVEWSAHSDLCLQLPAHCGRLLPDLATQARTSAVIPINDAAVAKPLKAMLRLLAARGGDLDTAARERALQSLAGMTMLGLSTPTDTIAPPRDGRDIPLAKAQRYLQAHFRRADLSADEVAAAVAHRSALVYAPVQAALRNDPRPGARSRAMSSEV
jgi:hypothetical protein